MKEEFKYCEHCGAQVYADAVMCPKCGRQIEELKTSSDSNPQIIINNNGPAKKKCDKLVAALLCFFLGVFGIHKFYEGRIGMGILYIFTFGLLGIGVFVDFIVILCKPNPYYV